jgi:hypothetical protein
MFFYYYHYVNKCRFLKKFAVVLKFVKSLKLMLWIGQISYETSFMFKMIFVGFLQQILFNTLYFAAFFFSWVFVKMFLSE